MPDSIGATYEHGVLRLDRPMDLAEGTRVAVIVLPRCEPDLPPHEPAARMTPFQIMAEIAAMAHESRATTQDARDHDRVLYGEAER